MAIKCLNAEVGIGERCENINKFSQLAAMFLAKPGVQFDTASDFADETVWNTKIAAGDIIPILDILEVENQNSEDFIYTTPGGRKIKNGDGIRGQGLKLLLDLKSHQILRGYSGKNWGCYKADTNKHMMGTSPDGTIVKPFKLQYFEVGMQGDPVAGGDAAFTPIEYQMADTEEWDTDGRYLDNPLYLPSQLQGVGTVVATQVGTLSTNDFVFDVKYTDSTRLNGQSSGADTEAAIEGGVVGSFQVLDASGAVITPTSVTEDAVTAGRYAFVNPSLPATVQMIATSDLKYKSQLLTLA